MKTNGLMTIVAIGFFTVLGTLGVQFYTSNQAIKAGLQQCLVTVDGKALSQIWAKTCDQVVVDSEEADGDE